MATVVALWATRGLWLPELAAWLDVGGPPGRADYVMVLGGGPHSRPFVAAALVRAGLAPQVLVMPYSGQPPDRPALVITSPELDWLVLRARGLSKEQIVPLGQPRGHTYGEAELLAEFLRSSPNAEVLVVTHGYHTRRARWAFRRALGRKANQVGFISAPVDDFAPGTWWMSEDGTAAILSEYLKLVYYWLRYGWLGYGLAAGVAAIVALYVFRRQWKTAGVQHG